MAGVAPHLLAPPVNALRISLHPDGIAPMIANLPIWRAAVFARLREQIDASADPVLADLLEELKGYPGGEEAAPPIPLILETPAGRLSLLGMTAMFGSPVEITLSELAVEAFLPADDATLALLQMMAGGAGARETRDATPPL